MEEIKVDRKEFLRMYWAKIDPNSNDAEVFKSICVKCDGYGCDNKVEPLCDNGRRPYKFVDSKGTHYALPLYLINDKQSLHGILKSVSLNFPMKTEGTPCSLGMERTGATDQQLMEYIEEIYQNCLYSDIKVDRWTESRMEYLDKLEVE